MLDVTTASLDPEVYGPDADRFDPHRVPLHKVKQVGLAFGEGPHTCIGAVMSVGEISARRPGPDDPLGLVPYTLRELFRAGRHADRRRRAAELRPTPAGSSPRSRCASAPGARPPPRKRAEMRLGIALGAPGGPSEVRDLVTLAQEAERLGFATAWTAEAYGCDAATTLGWLAAHTSRIGLGAAVLPDPGPHPGDDRDDRRDP